MGVSSTGWVGSSYASVQPEEHAYVSSSTRAPAPSPQSRLTRAVAGGAARRSAVPRARRSRRHSMGAPVAVALCPVLARAREFTAIDEWAKDAAESGEGRLARLRLTRIADESTFRQPFARLGTGRLEEILGAWPRWTLCMPSGRPPRRSEARALTSSWRSRRTRRRSTSR